MRFDTQSRRVQKSGGYMTRQKAVDDVDRLVDCAAQRCSAASSRVAESFCLRRIGEKLFGKCRDFDARRDATQSLRTENRFERGLRIEGVRTCDHGAVQARGFKRIVTALGHN